MPRSIVKHVGFASRRQDLGIADVAILRETRRIRVATVCAERLSGHLGSAPARAGSHGMLVGPL
eukprot:7251554-Pyramimonas_sp.AAC.1